MDDLPHLDWPIRVEGSRFSSIQQDTDSEVAAAVAALLCFRRGWRAEAPDFGITDPAFDQIPTDRAVAEIERQVGVYESRAVLEIELRDDGRGSQRIRVSARIAEETEV